MNDTTNKNNPFEDIFKNGQNTFSELQKNYQDMLSNPEKFQESQKQFIEILQKTMPNLDFKKQQAELSQIFSSENVKKQLAEISSLSKDNFNHTVSSMEEMQKNLQDLFKTMTVNPFDLPNVSLQQQAEAFKTMNKRTENFLDKIIQKSQENKTSK